LNRIFVKNDYNIKVPFLEGLPTKITAESLCCGTPAVSFKAGGSELITIPEYSQFVEYGDIKSLFSANEKILNFTFAKEIISKIAKQKYCKEDMPKNYLSFYEECNILS